MATLTSSLIVRLIDQVSGPARKAGAAIQGLGAAAGGTLTTARFTAAQQNLSSAISRNNAALAGARGGMVDAIAGFYALKAAIGSPVQAAMQFESTMADVKKVVDDFDTSTAAGVASFRTFKKELRSLSTWIPLTTDQLGQIAAAGGEAGFAADQLAQFTEDAAVAAVAFNSSAGTTGSVLAAMQKSYGMSRDEAMLLMDAMNHLSNSMASNAPDLMNFWSRIAADAKQGGFSQEQALALGSAMMAANHGAEVSATSFRNMVKALTRGESATKRQIRGFKELGISASQTAKNMQKDAVSTTREVLAAIGQLPAHMQKSVMSDIFGDEARALGSIATNLEFFDKAVNSVADSSVYAGSAMREFQIRADTFENRVTTFGNVFDNLKVSIGNALIPALTDLLNAITPAIAGLTAFAEAHPQLITNITAAVAGLVAFRAATAALTFVGLLGKGGALSLMSLGLNTVGRAAVGASVGIKGMVGYQTALASMAGIKLGKFGVMTAALRGMALAVPGVSAIGAALTAVGAALATVTAPVWGAIAAVVGALAAAGYMLYKHWDRVSSILSGVAARIGQELAPAFELLSPMLSPVGDAARAIGDGFNWAGEQIKAFGSWVGSFFQREILSDDQKAGFEKAGFDFADSMINAIKSAFAGLLEWFAELPGKILAAIGSIDLSRIIKWPTPPSWWTNRPSWMGGSGGSTAEPAPSGHRAAGGRVWPGGRFEVNEKGRETFTPDTGGVITPAGQGGLGGGPIQIGPFHIHNASDPGAVARQVSEMVKEEINSMLRGAHADSGARV